MPDKKIIDLSLYKTRKKSTEKGQGPSDEGDPSFEKKLKDLMFNPFDETRSKQELIQLFEDEELKKE